MAKITALLIFLGFCAIGSAQTVSSFAGVKLAYILPVSSLPSRYMDNKGPMAGIFFERNFANGVRLGAEVDYCYSTFSHTYSNLLDTPGFITYSGNSRYFAMPVHISFNALHKHENSPWAVYGKIGYMSYLHLRSEVSYEYQANRAFNKKLTSTQSNTEHYMSIGIEATYTTRWAMVSLGLTNYNNIKVSQKHSYTGFPSLSVDAKIGMRL